MEVLDLLKERFSPYAFTDKQLVEKDLLTLFEAAGKAASAFNEQPWRLFMRSNKMRRNLEIFTLV